MALARGALGLVGAVVGGIGYSYLLRHVSVLRVGPSVGGALPLQQLAGDAAQPLGRMLAAWLPAGAVAGRVLVDLARPVRGAVAGTVAALLLVAAGAASDAVAISDPFGGHLLPQLTRPGNLVAVAAFAGGSVAIPRRRRRRDPARAPAPGAR